MRTEQSFTAEEVSGRAGTLRRPGADAAKVSPPILARKPGVPSGERWLKRQGLLHDARNLLSAIELYCDLLSMPDVLRPEHRKYSDELRLLGRRSSGLLSQLMEAGPGLGAGMASGDATELQQWPLLRRPIACLESRIKSVSLRTIVGGCAGVLSRVAGACTVEFCYGPSASLPVGADVEAVERILLNLVRNAARATEFFASRDERGSDMTSRKLDRRGRDVPRPGRIRITVGQLPDAAQDRPPWPFQRVQLAVEDNGCGMAPRQVQRLLHGTDGSPGRTHGIGFRVVRELVQQSSGELRLRSVPGAGTRVEIEWPVWVAPAAETALAPIREAENSEFAEARLAAAGIIDGGAREPLPLQPESQQGVS